MPLKTFDSKNHVYKAERVRLPGATDVIKSHGLIEGDWFSPLSKYRGKAVHEGIKFINRGTLDWRTVAPEFKGYLESYQRFLNHTEYHVTGYEEPLITDTFGCIPDTWGNLHGKPSIVELKTGAVSAWVAFQTALQALAIEKVTGLRIQRRYGLQLMKDGSISRLIPFDDVSDFYLAVSMVAMFHWKLNHKINPWGDTNEQ